MSPIATHNVFDDLNDALTAQIAKLQSIDPKDKEAMYSCVQQSKAVAALAKNINCNTRNAIECVRLHSELAEASGDSQVFAPQLLKGSDDA